MITHSTLSLQAWCMMEHHLATTSEQREILTSSQVPIMTLLETLHFQCLVSETRPRHNLAQFRMHLLVVLLASFHCTCTLKL